MKSNYLLSRMALGTAAKWAVILFIVIFTATACTSDDDRKIAHYEKGVSYYEKGEYKSAQLEFKNALQIDPGFANGTTC